ncbi:hypothetical protein SAMN02745126_06353 [Enhydrobacter aerosaccus]|uniref:Uncharacterized protein n=1 Tax=Enhydrobacter aerosaccus TaxID=225324 RepID=A0A1T4TJ11_9HYPH|nr:hypothetical protein [Enhydrobacter aerosaccus]SKA40433.1 hypothetical protein SAMN02745126_06353 [Enhydrobacter aerosaccus]
MQRRTRQAIVSATLAVTIAGLMVSPAAAQSTITQGQLPANGNYTIVSTDASGNRVVQTQDKSILTTKDYAWNFNTNGNLGATDNLANAPSTQQNYNTGNTSLQLQNPSKITNGGHIDGVDDQTAANIAINQDAGCAVELCMAGQNQPSMAAACGFVLDWLNSLQKAGKQAPSCKGSTYTYTPPKCTAPWTLVTLSNGSAACQATLPPDNQAPTISQNVVNQCNNMSIGGLSAYPVGGGSWAVSGSGQFNGNQYMNWQFDLTVYPNGGTNYSSPWWQLWTCTGDGACVYIAHVASCPDLQGLIQSSSQNGCNVGGFSGGCDGGSAGAGASGG